MKELEDEKHSLFQMSMLIDEWKEKYHVNKNHELILQNKPTLANVRLPNNYLHKNHILNRGFSNLPEAITTPDEIWSLWKDPKSQRDVLRNYILYGENVNYVVSTENGVITSAKAVVNSRIQQYRKGLILFKL